MKMQSRLESAIELAVKAHFGQTDKSGKPYILHPLRLMLKFSEECMQMAAVLHDVAEDSDIELDQLREKGFPEQVVVAVDCLTRRSNESYEDFITRLLQNDIARAVKIEDLKDNLDVTRMGRLDSNDLARIEKYHRALRRLTII